MRNVFSVSVFLVHSGNVLLCHHKRFDMWLPVGGEIEPNETPKQAAIREVVEETGTRLFDSDFFHIKPYSPGEPFGFMGYDEHDAGVKEGIATRHLNFSFCARARSNNVRVCDEHHALEWFDPVRVLNQVPVRTTPNVLDNLRQLQDYFQRSG